MNGNEFERKIKKAGRSRGVPVSFDSGHGKGSHGRLYYGSRFTTLKDRRKEIGSRIAQGYARSAWADEKRFGGITMAFGYRYTLERQENGWWLVRFPGIPEALTEGETDAEARANAVDCVIAALEGYMKAGKPLPRQGAAHSGPDRAVLPSLVTAKLAVYQVMRERGWSKLKLAKQLGMPENSVRRLLDLRHSSHMWIIDEALAKMNAELSIDLPKTRTRGRAA
jgi:antitoxin HicB